MDTSANCRDLLLFIWNNRQLLEQNRQKITIKKIRKVDTNKSLVKRLKRNGITRFPALQTEKSVIIGAEQISQYLSRPAKRQQQQQRRPLDDMANYELSRQKMMQDVLSMAKEDAMENQYGEDKFDNNAILQAVHERAKQSTPGKDPIKSVYDDAPTGGYTPSTIGDEDLHDIMYGIITS